MSSCKTKSEAITLRGFFIVSMIMFLLAPGRARSGEFEASLAPDGRYLLKIYPKFFFTSAYFSEEGKALNLPDIAGLLYFELPVQIQYGVTGSLSLGAILPVGWTYQEEDLRPDPIHKLAVREFWLTLQHRWLTFPFISSSSIRLKVPLAKKEAWEDGLRIGDGQVDVYPVYHFDYFNDKAFWYVQATAGYKYRFKKGNYKPFDELRFYSRGGYELFQDLRMRFYLYADLTEFRNGEFSGDDPDFFEREGSLHHFGYGMSFWPRPSFRLEFTTGGDWSGSNQYRGIHWVVGITKIL
jgi:hypothetical protein